MGKGYGEAKNNNFSQLHQTPMGPSECLSHIYPSILVHRLYFQGAHGLGRQSAHCCGHWGTSEAATRAHAGMTDVATGAHVTPLVWPSRVARLELLSPARAHTGAPPGCDLSSQGAHRYSHHGAGGLLAGLAMSLGS